MADASNVDPYEAVIADLEQRIAAMQATIDNLKNVRSALGVSTTSTTTATRPASSTIFSHDSFFGMTVGDAAKKYLAAIKKTASATVIAEALEAGGWKTASKVPGDTIRAILSRHEDFVKVNGEFGLTEWYPGRKSAIRSRPVTARQASTAETAEEVVRAPGGDEEPW